MISERAKAGFDDLFVAALRSRLPRSGSDDTSIDPVMDAGAPARPGATIVVLTISSIRFRLLFMLDVAEDDAMRAYYVPDNAAMRFREAFAEVANLCGGLLSQGLQSHFPDLGMSTPYVLGTGCLGHLVSLKPGHLSRHAVTINGAVRIVATMCICAHAAIDFVPGSAVVEVCEGELELF